MAANMEFEQTEDTYAQVTVIADDGSVYSVVIDLDEKGAEEVRVWRGRHGCDGLIGKLELK
jgi:hypothetical protein